MSKLLTSLYIDIRKINATTIIISKNNSSRALKPHVFDDGNSTEKRTDDFPKQRSGKSSSFLEPILH